MISSITSAMTSTPFSTFSLPDVLNIPIPELLLFLSLLGFLGRFFGINLRKGIRTDLCLYELLLIPFPVSVLVSSPPTIPLERPEHYFEHSNIMSRVPCRNSGYLYQESQ